MNKKRMSPKEYMLIYGDDDEKKDDKKDVECDLIYKKLKEILDEHPEIKKVIKKVKFDDKECEIIKSKISIVNNIIKKK
jgi:hypothetical protein